MKYRHYYIIIFILVFWSGVVSAQTDCVTDPPLPPVLQSVSIEPETGYTEFTWSLSPSADIAAYIIYSYKNGDGMPLDTVWDPLATSYTVASTASKYFSVSYVVAAMRLPRCTSIFSNVITSVFENALIDTCMNKIVITWNDYTPIPLAVEGYSVLYSIGGGNYTVAGSTDATVTSFTLEDFTIGADYCFIIRADLTGSASSTSNKVCLSTKIKRPPQWINADQATVNARGKIDLSFTIDPLSEIRQFSLERKSGSTGAFGEISRPVSSGEKVIYTDNQAALTTVNYYRLSALNSCGLPVTLSNLASNIVLSLNMTGDNIDLSWNQYRQWTGNVSSYKLYVNTGTGYEEKAEIPASDSVFQLSYQQIMYDVTGNNVCFFVTASEISNQYGISGSSTSSEICTKPIEIVTVPNVFTPDNDLKNDFFKPVLSFTPRSYHLIIMDRQGKVLFETKDFHEEWDGTLNGTPEPQGVYLWYLKFTTLSGKDVSRTGTLTIIKNR